MRNTKVLTIWGQGNFSHTGRIHKWYRIYKLIDDIMTDVTTVKNPKKPRYYNVPCGFDIETTSFINSDGVKVGTMYIWQFGINGHVFIGRTYTQLLEFCEFLSAHLHLNENIRLIVYVHNLAYEFQFIRKWFTWVSVFASDNRKPIYAVNCLGIEFRCSYILTGYSLEKVGEHLTKYKINKLVGTLDYSKNRHTKTHVTNRERLYCAFDVFVIMCHIKECIEIENGIYHIPLTKTGYVRRYVRNNCFNGDKGKRQRYESLMRSLTIDPAEYKQLKRAFQGGYTHANCFYSGKTLENVSSYDFTSSYPTVLVSEQFPMSKSEEYTPTSKEDFEKCLKLYCCMFDCDFVNLEPKIFFENPLSESRCWNKHNIITNNGRVVSGSLSTTLTEQDFLIIRTFYKWEDMRIYNFRRYRKGYLPKAIIESILILYKNKTTLKGVEGKEVEYLSSKEQINSIYGCCVTDPIKDEWTCIDEWLCNPINLEDGIEKYNTSHSRFLYYPWGVWCTAYARKNLFTGILSCNEDYVYADTDSVKILNHGNHIEYFNNYNRVITEQLEKCLKHYKIDTTMLKPKTVKGVEKPLGVWDYEGTYTRFKTLGAKRYMTEHDGNISITVAGLNKSKACDYIKSLDGDPFSNFSTNLYVPSEHTNKLTHTYIDEATDGIMIDYNGVACEYHEKSYIHLGGADYNLSLSSEYIKYLLLIGETNNV